jgi:hypothetical protein
MDVGRGVLPPQICGGNRISLISPILSVKKYFDIIDSPTIFRLSNSMLHMLHMWEYIYVCEFDYCPQNLKIIPYRSFGDTIPIPTVDRIHSLSSKL